MHDWTRDDWLAYADRLLAGARVWASENFARITPPGASGGYGRDVDGLEGFARTFLLAGFRITGARGEGVDQLIEDYSRGIAAGVDPGAPDRWVRPDEHAQAKVEAASLALILDMTRPWIWDRLDDLTQQRVIDYFAPVVGDDAYPQTNWVWFRIVVQTFLCSVGGPWSQADIDADLATHESFVRDGGWLADGAERSYDHYVGWALHLYPILWARMQGAAELAQGRTPIDVERLDAYLQDAIALVGADGSPLIQGRSLVYRFAAAAPFWAGVFAEVPSMPLGQLRRAAGGIVSHFAERGVPNADDLLDLGWFGQWRRLAQNYSGTGSPYWAAKGMLGIALPADHPVWAADSVPLPTEADGALRVVAPAGWIISATADDGIARIVNHGTDHANVGDAVGDSPLYARLGYSTATSPLLNGDAWAEPLEQSVALVHPDGRGTHRAGMELLGTRRLGDAAIAGSAARAHWIVPDAVQVRHGSGITGAVEDAGVLTTLSVVRGAWEVRLVRVGEAGSATAPTGLRVGGWAIAADAVTDEVSDGRVSAGAGGRTSTLVALRGDAAAGIERREAASPLGEHAAVPVLTFPVTRGDWTATAVHLGAEAPSSAPALTVDADADAATATVTWTDGAVTVFDLTDPWTH